MGVGERHQLRSKLGIESEEDLKSQFIAFANFSNHGEQCSEMDGARFAKYCTDCKVLGKGAGRTEVDLAFAKCKDKGARRISFDQFLKALNLLAARRDVALCDVVQRALTFQGPVNHSSVRVGSVRLHDDKSTYTGVYARGGPTNTDGPHDLSQITNRKPADNRGVAHAPVTGHATASTPALTPRRMTADSGMRSRLSSGHGGPSSFGGSFMSPSLSCTGNFSSSMLDTSHSRTPRGTPRAGRLSLGHSPYAEKSAVSPAMMQLPGWESLEPLQQVFVSFALFGKGMLPRNVNVSQIKMESKAFAKLMKEAGVMEGKLNLTRVDLCYTKCCNKATKRMDFEEFKAALDACAVARGVDYAMMRDVVANCQPELRGTIAAQVKWHDDKHLYTGVHAKGGPSTIDKQNAGLRELVDREARHEALTAQKNSRRRHSFAPTWA